MRRVMGGDKRRSERDSAARGGGRRIVLTIVTAPAARSRPPACDKAAPATARRATPGASLVVVRRLRVEPDQRPPKDINLDDRAAVELTERRRVLDGPRVRNPRGQQRLLFRPGQLRIAQNLVGVRVSLRPARRRLGRTWLEKAKSLTHLHSPQSSLPAGETGRRTAVFEQRGSRGLVGADLDLLLVIIRLCRGRLRAGADLDAPRLPLLPAPRGRDRS